MHYVSVGSRLVCWAALAWMVLGLLGIVGSRRKAIEYPDGRIMFTQSASVAASLLVVVAYLLLASVHRILFELLWGVFFLSIVAEAPGSIVASNDCLEQIFWFRRNKRICWGDIVEIRAMDKGGTVTVVGGDGTKVVHTPALADRRRLLRELKMHCGENLPANFPSV